MSQRVIPGLCAAALVAPAVISVGGLALSFVPLLRDGVQPMILFMAAAAGLPGVFFFVFFFGAPVAFVVAALTYGALARRLERDPAPTGQWAATVGAALGAVLLPPVWSVLGAPNLVLRFLGPVVLGAAAGAAAGTAFWAVVLRRARSTAAAAER